MRTSLWALALSTVVLASGTTATAEVRPSVPVGDVVGTVHYGKKSSKLSADSKQLLSALVDANPDAVGFDITGYVQRTHSKRNDYRLSLARAVKVKRYLRELGVEVPIAVRGNRVPKVHGNKWFARRSVVRVVQPPEDQTPELQTEIGVEWGTWSLTAGAFDIPADKKGTWSFEPESYQYRWLYSFDDSTWTLLEDGERVIYDNPDPAANYHVWYTVSGATTDAVTMAATGTHNSFQECVYVKAQVQVTHAGFTSEWTDSNELTPLHVDCGWVATPPPA